MSDFALGFLGLALLAVGLFGLTLRLMSGSELGSGEVSFFLAVSGALFLGGALFSVFMKWRRAKGRSCGGDFPLGN